MWKKILGVLAGVLIMVAVVTYFSDPSNFVQGLNSGITGIWTQFGWDAANAPQFPVPTP